MTTYIAHVAPPLANGVAGVYEFMLQSPTIIEAVEECLTRVKGIIPTVKDVEDLVSCRIYETSDDGKTHKPNASFEYPSTTVARLIPAEEGTTMYKVVFTLLQTDRASNTPVTLVSYIRSKSAYDAAREGAKRHNLRDLYDCKSCRVYGNSDESAVRFSYDRDVAASQKLPAVIPAPPRQAVATTTPAVPDIINQFIPRRAYILSTEYP